MPQLRGAVKDCLQKETSPRRFIRAMPGILALDPGSKITGWAFSEPGAPRPEWGRFVVRHDGETAKDDAGAIGARFEVFLEARIDVFKPDFIVREQPYIPDGKRLPVNFETVFPLLGLAWQIDTIAERHGIVCQQATAYAAVKAFTGRGRYESREAKKRATIAMCKIHGWVCTEDEADALALLCLAETKLFPRVRQLAPTGTLFTRRAG